MKITKETKIGDIIPEGYEIAPTDGGCVESTISIHLKKKKEEKNFEWYIKKYFDTHFIFFVREDYSECMKEELLKGYSKVVDFEIRIGLLKFICDELNKESNIKTGWLYTLKLVQNYTKHTIRPKIMDICPKEFLDSIFE